ncbi:MAG: UvrD-helicase domain-containing protein, partial [Clostridia bacterium]|nr:UvrD-helicase domain-containing protein [Deltaproteobacteria bacterium]
MSAGHRFMRASAGTGKTYQLVQAYVGHVEADVSPSAIVAITFTRKAAAELRTRIRHELVKRNVAREHLDVLARAPIANFHGLALQMLQNVGAAVGFTDVPTIMGDLNEDQRMFRVACEEAWYGTDSSAKAALAEIASRMRIGGGGRAEPLIDTLWGAIAVAREDDDPRPLTERFVDYDAEGTRASVHAELVRARNFLEAHAEEMKKGTKGRDSVAAFLGSDFPGPLDDLRAWESKWRRAFRALHGSNLNAIGFAAAERNRLVELLGVPTAERLCSELAPSLQTLMTSAMRRYDAMKHETRSVDFADLLERVSTMLVSDKALHAQVRDRFKVVLVDEAQDTNASQRRFVHLIAGLEGPAGVASGALPATLFVVGDRKQSIYTFRGADPRSFNKFEEDLVGLSASVEQLDVSRRSSGAVVRAVNVLGQAILEGYEALEVLPGRVDVDDGVTWLVPEAPTGSRVSAEAEARCVARYIRGAIDRGTEPSAFAILLRATTKAPRFARALAALGVPSVITGGGGFYGQSEIIDVVALITWLA